MRVTVDNGDNTREVGIAFKKYLLIKKAVNYHRL